MKICKIFVNDKKTRLIDRYAVQNLDLDDFLCCPHDTITLKDKLKVLNRLKAAGCNSEEINIVRSKLSEIRGK